MPESKAHLVQANRAVTGKQPQFEQVEDDSDSLGLKDGFDWYMKPEDKAKYDQIYQESRDMRGEVSCSFGTYQLLLPYRLLTIHNSPRIGRLVRVSRCA